MAEEQKQHQHHHHHHHHKEDDATRFKRESLKAIRRRKIIKKWAFRLLCLMAVVMAILVVLAYTIG